LQAKIDRERFEHMWRTKTRIPSSWYPLAGDRMPHFSAQVAKDYEIVDEIR